MFTQLTFEQVSDRWNVLKVAIHNSMPHEAQATPSMLNQILVKLMSGELQCWEGFKQRAGELEIYMIVVTMLRKDEVTDRKTVFIHNLYSFRDLTDSEFNEGYLVLSRWGRAQGCEALDAFTNVDSLLHAGLRRGGKVTGYVSVPLM